MRDRDLLPVMVALPGALALGAVAGVAAFFAGIATGSEAIAVAVVVGAPAAAVRVLYRGLAARRRLVLAAVGICAAAGTAFAGLSGYSS